MGKRKRKKPGDRPPRTSGQCPFCGKKAYQSRKDAKAANRKLYPNEKMSEYRCVSAPDFADTSRLWHIGHLGPAVTRGKVTRSEAHGSGALHNPRLADKRPFPPELRVIVTKKDDTTS